MRKSLLYIMEKMANKIEILSAASLFAEAIEGIHNEQSLSYLFDN